MDFNNCGFRLFDREVLAGAVPEAIPTLDTDGYSLGLPVRMGGTVIPPYMLVLVDLDGGAVPTASIDTYLYFPEGFTLVSGWTFIRSSVIDKSSAVSSFISTPTLGASRVALVITSIVGAPLRVLIHVRGISEDQNVVLVTG